MISSLKSGKRTEHAPEATLHLVEGVLGRRQDGLVHELAVVVLELGNLPPGDVHLLVLPGEAGRQLDQVAHRALHLQQGHQCLMATELENQG